MFVVVPIVRSSAAVAIELVHCRRCRPAYWDWVCRLLFHDEGVKRTGADADGGDADNSGRSYANNQANIKCPNGQVMMRHTLRRALINLIHYICTLDCLGDKMCKY